jgi:sarcosine oxidase subunit gamma
MSDSHSFAPRSPLAAAAPAAVSLSGVEAGVTAAVQDGFGLATVLARKGASQALAQRVGEQFGLDLPTTPRLSATPSAAFVGVGPGAWLAMADQGGNAFAARLMRDLQGVASVSDQSDGYVLIRLAGIRVRDALSKLVPIDLDARAFKPGDVASTVASHIGVTLWRRPSDSDAAPVFEVVMFRSLAQSFWHALAEAASEYGFG